MIIYILLKILITYFDCITCLHDL